MFLRTHLATSIALAIAVWRHIRTVEIFLNTLLLITLGCFGAISVLQLCLQLYRNCASDLSLTQILDVKVEDAEACYDPAILKLRLRRPWYVQPGQYVHLRILSTKGWSWVQRHPFAIVWWEGTLADMETSTIFLMIQRRHGWTQNIWRYRGAILGEPAWLAGPYGIHTDFRLCHRVLLFASSSGIFAVLPIVKRLLQQVQAGQALTRRIKLMWLTESLYGEQLETWMNQLLTDDKAASQASPALTLQYSAVD